MLDVAYHVYYFRILFLASVVVGGHLCVFECVDCCFGSLNNRLLVVLFMLELSFRSCTSCWSCYICCLSASSWLCFVHEVDLDGDFSLLFMFKLLSCSTVVGLFATVLLPLVFLFKLVLLFLRLKCQSKRDPLVFLVFYLLFEPITEW